MNIIHTEHAHQSQKNKKQEYNNQRKTKELDNKDPSSIFLL